MSAYTCATTDFSSPSLEEIASLRFTLAFVIVDVNWRPVVDSVRGHSQMTSEERGREGVTQILTQ